MATIPEVKVLTRVYCNRNGLSNPSVLVRSKSQIIWFKSDSYTEDTQQLLKDWYNSVTDKEAKVDSTYYCMKGHNITNESWKILKEKGYRKVTGKTSEPDFIVTNYKKFIKNYTDEWRVYPATPAKFISDLKSVKQEYLAFVNGPNYSSHLPKPTSDEVQYELDTVDTLIKGLLDLDQDTYYLFEVGDLNPWSMNRNKYEGIGHVLDTRFSWRKTRHGVYKLNSDYDPIDMLNNQDKLIDQQVLLTLASEDKLVMNYEYYKQVDAMLKSSDTDNRELANRLIVSCNPKESFAYLAILFYKHSSHFYDSKVSFRDAQSKAFISEFNELCPLGIRTGNSIPIFYELKRLIDAIKSNNCYDSMVSQILLDTLRDEIMHNINYIHKELVDVAKLKEAIVFD